MGLQLLACWDCGFKPHQEHEYLSLVSVVCCQVEISALSWSLIQKSPTMCDVSKWVCLQSPGNGEAMMWNGIEAPQEKKSTNWTYLIKLNSLSQSTNYKTMKLNGTLSVPWAPWHKIFILTAWELNKWVCQKYSGRKNFIWKTNRPMEDEVQRMQLTIQILR
jgi:hypothetical protein